MNCGTEATLHVAGTMARVGGSIGLGISIASAQNAQRRAVEIDGVHELAIRLQQARRAQGAAERRAAEAESELAGALAELRLLREALRAEKQVTAALREVCGV